VGRGLPGAEGLVFTWADGRPVLPDYVMKAFAAMTERLEGLPRPVLHELRHTHATLLLRDRVPVHIVAKRLGRRDPSVTLNVYADAIPEDDDGRAVDVFSRAVWGALSSGRWQMRSNQSTGRSRLCLFTALTCGNVVGQVGLEPTTDGL
jgi:integrase